MSFIKIFSRLVKSYYFLLVLSTVLIISFANFLITSTCWSAVYYVDATNGNDANAGVSQSTPWKTIAKINASKFNPGDQLLFKRGETWREQLTVSSSGSSGNPITFGAYGSGDKPKILGSVNLSLTGHWALDSGNTWKTADTITREVGNLIFNNEASVGVRKTTKAALASQGDFYWDPPTHYLYIYSTSNPGTYYATIEAAQYIDGLVAINGGISYVNVGDLDIRYTAGHGIFLLGWLSNIDNIIVERNNVSFIGGSYYGSTTRGGNGIQVGESCTNITVRNNRMDNVYDAGIGIEGVGDNHNQNNVSIYTNIVTNCQLGIVMGFSGSVGSYSNIKILNNTLYKSSRGSWSDSQRADHLAASFWWWYSPHLTTSGLTFENNISYTSNYHVYFEYGNHVEGITSDYNLFYPSTGDQFWYLGNNKTFATWKSTSSRDTHSIATDPLFLSISDFHLQSTSPAIKAGLDVGLTQDYDQHAILSPPDIGAYKYDSGFVTPPTRLRISSSMTDGLFDNCMIYRFSFFSYTFPVVCFHNETPYTRFFLLG